MGILKKQVIGIVLQVRRRPTMTNRIRRLGWIYGITTIVFFLIDLIWIGVVAKDFYARTIGDMLRDSVNWPAALIFYLMYIGGIVLFVVVPAINHGSGLGRTALMGGLLGLFAYGTFDLTALALFEGWPLIVTIVDMSWGSILTAGTSCGTLWVARIFPGAYGLQGQ
jgi:uncharacterized membrane protein